MKYQKQPTQKRLSAVDVFEDTIVASFFEGNRVKRQIVTPAQVVRMFAASADSGATWQDLSASVVAVGDAGDGSRRVLVVRKAKKTKITCQIGSRTHKPLMRMPNLLAELAAAGKKWTGVKRVFAFRGTLKKTTPLYVAPLPNMYADARVCMGNITLEPLSGLAADEAFEKAYIDSLFSDHILDGPMRSSATYRNIWDAIKKTKGNVPFSALKKVTTYGELITS